MTNHSINARYHGANVRIVSSGTGLDSQLIVQRLNPLAGNWIDAASYDQSYDRCHSLANEYAAYLSHELFLESKRLTLESKRLFLESNI